MRYSNDLYKEILGIEYPWEVETVEVSTDQSEVLIYLKYEQKEGVCPECGEKFKIYDYEKCS